MDKVKEIANLAEKLLKYKHDKEASILFSLAGAIKGDHVDLLLKAASDISRMKLQEIKARKN